MVTKITNVRSGVKITKLETVTKITNVKQGNRHPRARQGGGVPAGVNHRAADQILP